MQPAAQTQLEWLDKQLNRREFITGPRYRIAGITTQPGIRGFSALAAQAAAQRKRVAVRAEAALRVVRAADPNEHRYCRIANAGVGVSADPIRAAEALIKLEAREARLLGLDMPTKVAVTDPDGNGIPLTQRQFNERFAVG